MGRRALATSASDVVRSFVANRSGLVVSAFVTHAAGHSGGGPHAQGLIVYLSQGSDLGSIAEAASPRRQ